MSEVMDVCRKGLILKVSETKSTGLNMYDNPVKGYFVVLANPALSNTYKTLNLSCV